LFGVAVPSQALQEAYQSRQDSDQRSYAVDVRTATIQLMPGQVDTPGLRAPLRRAGAIHQSRFGEQHAHAVAVVDLLDVEADEILHVQEYSYQAVHLIAKPKVRKRDHVHGCGETLGQVGEQPASGTAKAAPKRQREEQLGQEADHVGVQIADHGQSGDQQEHRAHLEHLLVGEVAPGIDFENQHVVDTVALPAVHVDADEEDVDEKQQKAAEQTHGYPTRFTGRWGQAD
ncbi:hypothetical protein T4E_9547, partial [Trichinella pseudospiralis]